MDSFGLFRPSRVFLTFLLVVFTTVSLSGCTTLRKKFTRKKKTTDQVVEFIPVLEPLEYKRVEEEPLVIYKNHYAMVRAYFKDAWDALGSRSASDKEQKYVLTQLGARFDAVAWLLTDGEKKKKCEELSARVQGIIKEYDKAGGIRRYDIMKSDLRRIEDDFRRSFKPGMIKEDLKK